MKSNNEEKRLILMCLLSVTLPSIVYQITQSTYSGRPHEIQGRTPGPQLIFSFSFRPNWGPQGAKKKIPRPGRHQLCCRLLCDFSSLCPDRCLTRPSGSMHFGDVDNANGGLRDPKHMGRADSPWPRDQVRLPPLFQGRAREKAHGKHNWINSWICVETSLLARAENTIIFFKFPQYKEYYGHHFPPWPIILRCWFNYPARFSVFCEQEFASWFKPTSCHK